MIENVPSSNKRIAKNTLFLYIRLVVVMLVNLYTTRVVLGALGVEDYGVYNVVCGFVAMFGFLNTSITNGIQRFYNYELGRGGDEAVIKVFNTGLAIQSVIALIVTLLLFTAGWWYLNNELVIPESRVVAANWVFSFSIFSLVIVVMQAPYGAAIIAYERMNFYAVVSVIDAFAKLVIAFGVKLASIDKLVLYGLLLLLTQLLMFILHLVYCKYNFKHLRLCKKFEKSLFKSMLSFSGWNVLGSFAFMLRGQGVNVLLNIFFGTIVNAANGIASQMASAVQAFSLNIMIAFQPQLTQSYAVGNYNRTEQLMLNMTKISYLLYCVVAIPIVVEINYVLRVWLGNNIPDYTEPFAILTIAIMGLGLFHTSITQTFHATGKVKKFQIITSVIICSIIPISWLLLNNGSSPEIVYVVTLAAYLVTCVICLIVLHRIFAFNIKRYAVMVVESGILTILAFLLAWLANSLMSPSFIRLICVFVITLISLSIGLWFTSSKSNREQLVSAIRQKIVGR